MPRRQLVVGYLPRGPTFADESTLEAEAKAEVDRLYARWAELEARQHDG